MGYSSRIDDPAFVKYLANSERYALLFSFIIAAAAILGFWLYGVFSNEMDNPDAVFIGMGIGGMFIAIAWLTNWSKKGAATWDGRVCDKRIEKKVRNRTAADMDYHAREYLLYTVIFQSESGRTAEITVEGDDTLYNYYQVGDMVRHHGRLRTYEKYDKSQDTIIFCNACASLNEITDDHCFRCNCPLLK